MNKPDMDGTKQIYLKLDHALEFRLIRTTAIYFFFSSLKSMTEKR